MNIGTIGLIIAVVLLIWGLVSLGSNKKKKDDDDDDFFDNFLKASGAM